MQYQPNEAKPFSMKDGAQEMTDALDELAKRQAEFDAARSGLDEARRKETRALNDLNEQQKRVDAIMKKIRANSSGGDWSSSRGVVTAAVDWGQETVVGSGSGGVKASSPTSPSPPKPKR